MPGTPSLRPAALVALASLGCAKAAVLHPTGSPDGAARAGDAVGAIVVQLDAPADETAWAQEDSACKRTVSLQDVTITRPVPFDVIIVADNSDSLSWSRDSLSAGLRNLLGRVHGHEARFFVLTTTQYGASSQAAVSPLSGKTLVSWQDPVSGAAYENAVTRYTQQCVDGLGAPSACPQAPPDSTRSWKVTGTWQLQMPAAVAAITSTMADAEIAEQQRRIADAILGLGGGGSQQEQPICTLLRYLGQDAAVLPRHAVFVVISDEDDQSPPAVCLAGYEAVLQTGIPVTKEACESNCPEYVYLLNRRNQEERLDFTCVPVDDKGTTHPEQATPKSLVVKAVALCTPDAGGTAIACSEAELGKAGVECGAGTIVQGCTHTCAEAKSWVQCSLSRPDDQIDLCRQPFDQGGAHYTNLLDYCTRTTSGTGWETCSVMGLQPATGDGGTASSRSERTTPVVAAQSTAELIAAVKSRADRLIGKNSYAIEAIVLDPAFSCPLHSGQSYAPNLRSLASSASDVFPLCEDYAPAIARIASFADYLIQTTFPLALDDYEAIEAVAVIDKQGVARTLPDSGYSYDRTAQTLRFVPGVLTAQDASLAVNVARYCQIVIP